MLDYNVKTYEEAREVLRTSNRVAIIQATGTGKSSVIARFLDDYKDDNKLILAPTIAILEQFVKYYSVRGSNVKLVTYAKLHRVMSRDDGEEIIKNELGDLKLIVTDELHRLGAEKWGESFNRLLDMYPDAKVVGATATPVRFTDVGRDMAEEVFGGNTAGNISLSDAIKNGILPKPTYVAALYDIEEDVAKAKKKITESKFTSNKDELLKKVDKLKIAWNSVLSIDNILKKHLGDKVSLSNGLKVIVFFPNIGSLHESMYTVEKWFKCAFPSRRIELFINHSEKYDGNYQYETFRDSTVSGSIKLLLVVNKLNEGVHIDDVEAIIMLRKTVSNIVYYQQIGRALSIGSKGSPVIIDLVNNCDNVGKLSGLWGKLTNTDIDIKRTGKNKGEEVVKVFDYTRNVARLFDEINKRTDPEYIMSKVREAVENGEDINNLSDINLQKFVRYAYGIRYNADIGDRYRKIIEEIIELGGGRIMEDRWTKEEDDIIKKYYPIEGENIKRRLNGRTYTAIKTRARKLGVFYKNRWTKEEDDILRKYYPIEGVNVIKRLENRTENAIKARSSSLRLEYIDKRWNAWTKEEDDIIRKYYPTEGTKVVEMLKNRTAIAITTRARNLGVKYVAKRYRV